MINYIEKGRHMHAYIRRQGHWLRQEDGVWLSSDDTAVQAIIDAYDPAQDIYKWEEEIEALDEQVTPRKIEDIYDGVVAAIGNDNWAPAELKALMDARKAKRAAKPV